MRVLVPTRDRPENARRVIESFYDTKTLNSTGIFLVLDMESPHIAMYGKMVEQLDLPIGAYFTTGNMVERTNAAARALSGDTNIIGWAADDNVFVTKGWDEKVTETFEDEWLGLVDTNDLLVTPEDKKTGACFIRSSCIRALGYFYLPACEHLYVDRAAVLLYEEARAYKRRDDVVIVHNHPYAGKAQWDENYARYNTPTQDSKDGKAFLDWHQGADFLLDAQRIANCLPRPRAS